MATRKRNEWLEAEASDDDDAGYDSDALEDSRGRAVGSRASKRREVNMLDDADESGDEIYDDAEYGLPPLPSEATQSAQSKIPEDDAEFGLPPLPSEDPIALPKKHAGLTAKEEKKSGVVYISRVPPFMKPSTIRTLLSPYGAINRIFLQPEDSTARSSRLKSGGNRKRNFTDGWVEFIRKRDAKMVVEMLNGQIIGGKKGGWYHDDVWNLKYLKGKKWRELQEERKNENAERAAKVMAGVAQSTMEQKMFVENVERAKMLEGMEAKRKEREGRGDVENGIEEAQPEHEVDGEDEPVKKKGKEFKRHFRQSEVKLKKAKEKRVEQPEEVKRVLSKIF
ncbi:Pre-rRNA-processing protein ESF2 [Rhizodiscina lignyota]|uniref:18S rRNA factor 2 n=1 Tax=Rhizodiscina lignyota TaxID=1504668 RepID=A0A9P4INK8_9PEZI|nr:Pre-rRNA-processing protein ESF2 [Rhizodiscina lignyota]